MISLGSVEAGRNWPDHVVRASMIWVLVPRRSLESTAVAKVHRRADDRKGTPSGSRIEQSSGKQPRRSHPCRKVRCPGTNKTLTCKKRGNPLQTGQDRVIVRTSNWTASSRSMATNPAVAKKAAAKAAPKAPAKTAASTPVPKKTAPAKAPAAPAKKSTPAPTIAMKAVFEQLADSHDLSKRQAQSLLTDMVEAVTTHLKNGDRIRINGLGILEVRNHEARMGRNPATGEPIQIAASKKVAFRPAKELKDAIDYFNVSNFWPRLALSPGTGFRIRGRA